MVNLILGLTLFFAFPVFLLSAIMILATLMSHVTYKKNKNMVCDTQRIKQDLLTIKFPSLEHYHFIGYALVFLASRGLFAKNIATTQRTSSDPSTRECQGGDP